MTAGECVKEGGCECVGEHSDIRLICPDWIMDETPPEYHHLKSIADWQNLPLVDRLRCLDHLRMVMADHPVVMARWRRQAAEGMAIGSDDIRFHFGAGMAVRNVLRQVMTDDKLPGPEAFRNWDDFYYGAIDELAREPV